MSEFCSLKDKVVIITGGAAGAGEKIARVFAQSGCQLIITYNHSKASAQKLSGELGCEAVCFDQADIASIPGFVNGILERYGHIDGLINNAGIYPAKPIEKISEADWDQMLDTNSKAIFFLTREVCEAMKRSQGGSIVNISSINAANPSTTLTHYGASKSAVEFITKAMAVNYGPKVRVNAIAPGLIYKKGQEQWIPGWPESYCQRAPLHRLVLPEEIGKSALFFISDLSSAVTGQTLTVDCGITLSPCFDFSMREES